MTGKELRERRINLGLVQQAVADEAHTTQPAISNLEAAYGLAPDDGLVRAILGVFERYEDVVRASGPNPGGTDSFSRFLDAPGATVLLEYRGPRKRQYQGFSTGRYYVMNPGQRRWVARADALPLLATHHRDPERGWIPAFIMVQGN